MNASPGTYADFVSVTIASPEAPPVQETIRYDQFVRWLFKADTEPMMALHSVLGLSGELGELIEADQSFDERGVIEDAGDFEFYLQAVRNHYGIVRSSVQDFGQVLMPSEHPEVRLTIAVGELVDVVKREYIYGKPRDMEALRIAITKTENAMRAYYPIPRISILQANANKLSKSYSALRYSDADAIARADKNAPGT
jgi:hypothetical protein